MRVLFFLPSRYQITVVIGVDGIVKFVLIFLVYQLLKECQALEFRADTKAFRRFGESAN